jgi:hypothetical protein
MPSPADRALLGSAGLRVESAEPMVAELHPCAGTRVRSNANEGVLDVTEALGGQDLERFCTGAGIGGRVVRLGRATCIRTLRRAE